MTAQVHSLTSLQQLAVQLVDAQNLLYEAQTHVDDIKAAIRDHPDVTSGGHGTYHAGNLTLHVQPNTRFDQNLAAKAIPPELLPLVTVKKVVETVDRKKVEV